MSDKFENPFLSPPSVKDSAQNSSQDISQGLSQGLSQVQAATQSQLPPHPPLQPQQQPQQPIQPQAPMAQTGNPFTTAPQSVTAQPVQQPVQQPAQQPASPMAQPPQQQAQQPTYQPQIMRETAAQTGTPRKAPNPFDFANQGTSGGGQSGQGTQAAASGGRLRYQALSFTGGVGEYYGIVILNYLLTMITLGLFSPWAKVRKLRYFHSHTEFLDEGLQYLATGKQLFIGRIVAILALVALSLAELIPVIGIMVSLAVILFGLPFVLNRSVRFNARNIAWRDVRFGWDGTMPMAILVWLVYPLLSLLTLGLAQPLAARALRRHYAENHTFGGASFSADLTLGSFYIALLKGIIFTSFMLAIFGGVTGAIAYASLADKLAGITTYDELVLITAFLSQTEQALLALPAIGVFFALYVSGGFYFALVRHVMINHLRLQGGIRFQSQLSAFKYAMVILSNLMINIMTIGFAHPFTVVRHYRYLTQAIEVRPIANMAGFIDAQAKAGFSIFEEAADIEGLSIDL